MILVQSSLNKVSYSRTFSIFFIAHNYNIVKMSSRQRNVVVYSLQSIIFSLRIVKGPSSVNHEILICIIISSSNQLSRCIPLSKKALGNIKRNK